MDVVSLIFTILGGLGIFTVALDYWLQRRQRRSEEHARRMALLTILRDRVESLTWDTVIPADWHVIPGESTPTDRWYVYQSFAPIHLTVPAALLDGSLLHFTTDGTPIRLLFAFEEAIQRYNAVVADANTVAPRVPSGPTSTPVDVWPANTDHDRITVVIQETFDRLHLVFNLRDQLIRAIARTRTQQISLPRI
jgi:hypothetical protein